MSTDKADVSAAVADKPEAPAEAPVPPPPSLARQFVRYILGFGVSVAVGLAPYLGRVDVPLFDSLLKLIPTSIHDTVFPLSAALMGVVAVVVQWYGEERVSKAWLKKYFKRTLLAVALSFIALFIVHIFVVVKVLYLGGAASETFLVGFVRPNRPPCPAEVSDTECIKHLTLSVDAVESFWGSRQIRIAKIALILPYLIFTGGFGMLIGLLLLRDRMLKAPLEAA